MIWGYDMKLYYLVKFVKENKCKILNLVFVFLDINVLNGCCYFLFKNVFFGMYFF